MGLTVQNVYGLLLRSRLLAANDARTLYERWQKEAKDAAGDVDRFRRWLVGHHYLTDYQAGLLIKGHTHGFFIGDYKILDRLGRGRMAGVYKAVHSTGQIVAIKVLPPSKAKVPYLLSRFEREAKLAIQLKHPHCVRAFQMGVSDGLHWIVMEYLEGETLDDVIHRRRKLPPGEAVRLGWQILQGMQHIHEKQMVHRDLKPSNIMLSGARPSNAPDTTLQHNVKILDIGLGRMFFDENAYPEEGPQDQLTGEGVLLGTPDYLAPEQARNARGVDIRADVYSLGCVLYHCMSGQVPFPDTNIINQIIRHSQEVARPLREFNPEVSDALQQVINIMMAKDANQRYATPIQAAQALQPLLPTGTEPVRFGDDAQMSQYLTALEMKLPPAGAPGPKVAGATQKIAVVRPLNVPAPAPAKAAVVAKDSKSGRPNRHSKHGNNRWWKKKKRKSKEAINLSTGNSATIDVELMTGDPETETEGLSRRDWLLIALGATAVVGAITAGGMAAYMTHTSD